MWRHGYTGFFLATYGIDGGTISAVRASRPCAPSGPPANAPGPRYGIANGRNAGTCRGGEPLGGLLAPSLTMAAVLNLRCLKNNCSLASRLVLFGYGLARNLIERFFNKIEHCRQIATRYERLAANYLAFLQLVSIRLWLRAYKSAS